MACAAMSFKPDELPLVHRVEPLVGDVEEDHAPVDGGLATYHVPVVLVMLEERPEGLLDHRP
jgi:hypothetical protein